MRYSHCLHPHVFTFPSSQIPADLAAGLFGFSNAANLNYENLIISLTQNTPRADQNKKPRVTALPLLSVPCNFPSIDREKAFLIATWYIFMICSSERTVTALKKSNFSGNRRAPNTLDPAPRTGDEFFCHIVHVTLKAYSCPATIPQTRFLFPIAALRALAILSHVRRVTYFDSQLASSELQFTNVT